MYIVGRLLHTKSRTCFAGNVTIAKEAGLGVNTVRRAIEQAMRGLRSGRRQTARASGRGTHRKNSRRVFEQKSLLPRDRATIASAAARRHASTTDVDL
jgi:hypothetical protein